jgi:hypothetical protein
MATVTPENTSVIPHPEPSGERDVETVPYVELVGRRLQGVVSSGSDPNRVYCAFLEAGSGDHYSSTNNNRPDAGTTKRLTWLVEEAVAQFGLERVVRFLELPGDPSAYQRPGDVVAALTRRGTRRQGPAGVVFSRFLNYLRFVELETAPGPVPEMAWFVSV